MKLRRIAAGLLALIAAFAIAAPAPAADYQPTVGLQTWTCRNMNFDQVVEFAVKHNLKQIQMIGNHMSPAAPREETLRKKAVLDAKGLTCYTFGVAGTSANKEENRKLFEFAKLMGIKVIIVEPKNDAALWDGLEELVKEYDIKLAIHNHGLESVYGSPEKVWSVLKNRDKRIGVCMDVGHITGAGFDAAKAFREYGGRVYDIHLKDKKSEKTADGKKVILDVMVGTGEANYAGLLAELKKAKWPGVMAIETDNATFAKEPTEFVAGAIKFVKENAK
ncbi:MAG: sugar phosphate isomerase/epimerase [Verrucomicrobia bacterium]|nr:sugar phosphate isomerase/epimerase [Verrucomicrobiota bacterium]